MSSLTKLPMVSWIIKTVVVLFFSTALSQFPSDPTGLETLKTQDGVTVRVKESTGVCETKEGVRSFAGYVDLADDIHMHFWYIESRNNPEKASTTLLMPAGPIGDMSSAVFAVGPCKVVDGIVEPNEDSWNNYTSLLLVDMPVGKGFSYSTQVTGFLDEDNLAVEAPPEESTGRWPLADFQSWDTTRETVEQLYDTIAAIFETRPAFAPELKSTKINFSGASYAGRMAPDAMDVFRRRNNEIANGEREGVVFELGSLSLAVGCVDAKYEAMTSVDFVRNNTYGIQMVNETVAEEMAAALPECLIQIDECRALDFEAGGQKQVCGSAAAFCNAEIQGKGIDLSFRDLNNIMNPGDQLSNLKRRARRQSEEVDPVFTFFNQPDVLNALGARVNYTGGDAHGRFFHAAGDYPYGFSKEAIESVLDAGAQVYMWFGDADYNCNWMAGERLSLDLEYSQAESFRSAGYAPLMVNNEERGAVRQHGNLSFIRLYEAGHSLLFESPDAHRALFNRSIFGLSTADGVEVQIGQIVKTIGPATSDYLNEFVPLPDDLEDAGGPPQPRTPGGLLTQLGKSEVEITSNEIAPNRNESGIEEEEEGPTEGPTNGADSKGVSVHLLVICAILTSLT